MTEDMKKQYAKDYYKKNKEHLVQYKKDYYQKNKEKILLSQKNRKDEIKIVAKEWRKKNPEKVKAKNQRWYLENKDYMIKKAKIFSKTYEHRGVEKLSYHYIKNRILKIRTKEKTDFLTNLIEAKRLQMMIERELKK
jgi:hypothetical protein